MKIKRYGVVLILCLGFAACKQLDETPNSASGEQTISGTGGEQKPLKINSNKKYAKHRQVNRQVIHKIHRHHRA